MRACYKIIRAGLLLTIVKELYNHHTFNSAIYVCTYDIAIQGMFWKQWRDSHTHNIDGGG